MNTQFLENYRIYLISNCAVARNPLFVSPEMQMFFKKKMEYYLDPLCNIMAYSLKDHEFRILVKLKSREKFEDYFRKEKEAEGSYTENIPESTYIFSQVMSNLQVSFVKKFNHIYNRCGTLMAGRYKRSEIVDSKEVWSLIQELNKGESDHSYSGIWVNEIMNGCVAKTSRWIYGDGLARKMDVYLRVDKIDLVDHLITQGEKQIILPHSIHSRRTMAAIRRFLE